MSGQHIGQYAAMQSSHGVISRHRIHTGATSALQKSEVGSKLMASLCAHFLFDTVELVVVVEGYRQYQPAQPSEQPPPVNNPQQDSAAIGTVPIRW